MSTHAFVGNKADLKDGHIIGSSIHWNGYPENVGWVLHHYWNTKEKLDLLLSGGNLSSLGEVFAPEPGESLDLYKHCIFYHRDRGESFRQITLDYPADSQPQGDYLEYYYLFVEGVGYEVYNYDGKQLMTLEFDKEYDYDEIMETRLGIQLPVTIPEGDVFW